MMKQFLLVFGTAAVTLMMSGCALWPFWPFTEGPQNIIVAQSSQQCNTQSSDLRLSYFATPAAFQNWIDRRDIREFRSAAASLRGVFVVELGLRPTSGYSLELLQRQSGIADNQLNLTVTWDSPAQDDAVAQLLVSPCLVIIPPEGKYKSVVLYDDTGAEQERMSFTPRK